MSEATLVFPHQLFERHPAVAAGRVVCLVEDPLWFGNDRHWPAAMHRQKLVLLRASMAAYREELEAAGLRVRMLAAKRREVTDSLALLERGLPRGLGQLHLADPADDVLGRRLRRFAARRGIELHLYPSPNFLSPAEFLDAQLAGKKRPFMANFYIAQRKRLAILIEDDGGPMGGKWSFDAENREKLPPSHPVPPAPRVEPDGHVAAALRSVARDFPDRPGSLEDFRWPVTRAAARDWFERFLRERFADFGRYEDAISTRHAFLHHAAITPMLNLGLLDPREVVERTLGFAARSGKVPLNSLEGFIRQVIGWREFMHGIYRHHGVAIRTRNFWNFSRPMPGSFYRGDTGIPPVDRVIRQVLGHGYCHHIERLMVLGNFMLLCRIRPDDVYRWFMEMFVDSHDWVMVPNVYGMSQFADGGTFTTKPYLSGSNYIRKMSDEPAGDWCAVWDGLFWSFIADHPQVFHHHPRLAMMARTWEKMSREKREGHLENAGRFLAKLDAETEDAAAP